jgi:hypothetical protein
MWCAVVVVVVVVVRTSRHAGAGFRKQTKQWREPPLTPAKHD